MKFLLILLLTFLPMSAYALTATVSGTQVQTDYTEPSTNATGTPLLDLAKTTTYYKIGTAARVKCDEKPASAPTGGQTRQSLCLVPVLANQEADVDIVVTATDTSGNESVESAAQRVRIDRLAPAAPR
jgi:hypothetical protein